MSYFSLETITIKHAEKDISKLDNPLWSRPFLKISDEAFFIDIKNVAQYRVQNGKQILIKQYKNSDAALVKLYLEGTVLAALLHQRCFLPFHGTSFNYVGKNVIICGVSGAGKSSVSVAFCQNEAKLISDDVSPIRMDGSEFFIQPLKSDIKLWKESLQKLNLSSVGLSSIGKKYDKYYFPTETMLSEQKLDQIIILGKHDKKYFDVTELTGMDKFNVLRKNVYRREYLRGMPKTEKNYFNQLFQLGKMIKVTEIIRPNICNIHETMHKIEAEIVR